MRKIIALLPPLRHFLYNLSMQQIPLAQYHRDLGAKMVEFAGYEMPVSYASIVEEHQAVRQNVGIFDVSHMGEFILRGARALDLLQHITSNDVSKLQIGDAQYSCLPNGKGGIVDDLLVYRLSEELCSNGEKAFMLVVNASNMQKDWDWIKANNPYSSEEVQLIDISARTTLLAVQGPKAAEMLQTLTEVSLSDMKYYSFRKGEMGGCPNVLISATGYTGAGGFELYVDNAHAAQLWEAIWQAGKAFDLRPIGLGARDTLRLEKGYCLYGNDIDDTTSPIEAGLGWITKFNKGEFIDRERLLQHKQAGTARRLVGLEILDKRPARHGYALRSSADLAGEDIGIITSGTKSPSLDKNIALAYVATAQAKEGSTVYIDIRGKAAEARVVKLPFL